MSQKGILIVISGFSGAGKGTLVKKLTADYDNYALSISMTTRQPREGEVDGREYFFVTKQEFEKRIAENGMIEYAGYCDNYYGTPRAYVEQQLENGKDVILEIEIQGAHKVKEQYPQAVLLFVMPPSAQELYRRLKGRGTETEEVIMKRMARAVEESEGIDTYDYIVVNDKLEDCIGQINAIVDAAHNTPENNEEYINMIQKELKELLKGDLK
nr:guanylate kinase [Lachnospiraceae bacterium]